ncbi:MAG: phospholipase [Chlorobi bacterium]|nr:MAG: Phospholipase D precursor [Chlorobi bacterium OLB7]MBK8911137.1 phospholipase [Chlorobiota bacterium]
MTSSRRKIITIIGLLLLAVSVLTFMERRRRAAQNQLGGNSKEASGTKTSPTKPNPPGDATGPLLPDGDLAIFFSDTYANDPTVGQDDPNNIDRHLAALFGTARKTIDGAFFELESKRIADALIAAHRRGVKVRLVTDSDYENNEEMRAVVAAGIPVIFDGRSALMHNKFAVIDGATVWTGSYNITDNCAFRNNNNGLMIRSEELAENYATEFKEMFVANSFGARSPSETPHTQVKVGSATIYNYFSPEDDIPPKILRYLSIAKKSIHFMAFNFTDGTIAEAMIEKEKAGVQVEGVIERRGAERSVMEQLQDAGITVLKDGNKYVMHHKVIIIDGEWTITGSYNFTGSAATQNDENILIIRDPSVAKKFEEEYQRVKQMAEVPS